MAQGMSVAVGPTLTVQVSVGTREAAGAFPWSVRQVLTAYKQRDPVSNPHWAFPRATNRGERWLPAAATALKTVETTDGPRRYIFEAGGRL
jgi:hypothetical protein